MEMEENKGLSKISRIDKNFMSPDGIHDLSSQFGEHAPLVMEIISFLGVKFKYNFFNLFNTSVDEFSKITGIDKSTLNRAVPLGPHLKKYPKYNGHEFKSYFDYTIYMMLSRNWIFSKPVHTTYKDNETKITSIQILEEIIVRKKNEHAATSAKLYSFRISEKLMAAMQGQFWPIDVDQKKRLGQFKRSQNARALFTALSAWRHTALSQKKNYAIVTLNDLVKATLLKEEQEPKHLKQAIIRNLNKIKNEAGFEFDFEFFSPYKHKEDYHIKLQFYGKTLEGQEEIIFSRELHAQLEIIFNKGKTQDGRPYKDLNIPNEKNTYQRWVQNPKFDAEQKSVAVQMAYRAAYKKVLPLVDCMNYVHNGFSNLFDLVTIQTNEGKI